MCVKTNKLLDNYVFSVFAIKMVLIESLINGLILFECFLAIWTVIIEIVGIKYAFLINA